MNHRHVAVLFSGVGRGRATATSGRQPDTRQVVTRTAPHRQGTGNATGSVLVGNSDASVSVHTPYPSARHWFVSPWRASHGYFQTHRRSERRGASKDLLMLPSEIPGAGGGWSPSFLCFLETCVSLFPPKCFVHIPVLFSFSPPFVSLSNLLFYEVLHFFFLFPGFFLLVELWSRFRCKAEIFRCSFHEVGGFVFLWCARFCLCFLICFFGNGMTLCGLVFYIMEKDSWFLWFKKLIWSSKIQPFGSKIKGR